VQFKALPPTANVLDEFSLRVQLLPLIYRYCCKANHLQVITQFITKMNSFEIQKYLTKLTRRLLESSPGSTVEFTLDELLQKAKYAQSWPATGQYIHTGILTVYQMAARQEPPSESAKIALRAVQYREPESGFECTKCQKIDGLCLRVDPAKYP
jgi:hypothetical protein